MTGSRLCAANICTLAFPKVAVPTLQADILRSKKNTGREGANQYTWQALAGDAVCTAALHHRTTHV
jgi:hypothetical protein